MALLSLFTGLMEKKAAYWRLMFMLGLDNPEPLHGVFWS